MKYFIIFFNTLNIFGCAEIFVADVSGIDINLHSSCYEILRATPPTATSLHPCVSFIISFQHIELLFNNNKNK